MYIKDVVKEIEKYLYYLYADDMVIYTPPENADKLAELHQDLDRVFAWYNTNKLTMNINKTKAQLFPQNSNTELNSLFQNNPVRINNTNLQYEYHFRYWGIELDHLLTKNAVSCCLNIKNPCDAHVNDLHKQLNLHLLDHRWTVQLLTCIKKGIENGYFNHIKPVEAILRNQSLKVRVPIPRNDTVKKSNFYWGFII